MAFKKGHRRSGSSVFAVRRDDGDGESVSPNDQSHHWSLPVLVKLGRRLDVRDSGTSNIDNDATFDNESQGNNDSSTTNVVKAKTVTFDQEASLRYIEVDSKSGSESSIDLIVPLSLHTSKFLRSQSAPVFVGESNSDIQWFDRVLTPDNPHLFFSDEELDLGSESDSSFTTIVPYPTTPTSQASEDSEVAPAPPTTQASTAATLAAPISSSDLLIVEPAQPSLPVPSPELLIVEPAQPFLQSTPSIPAHELKKSLRKTVKSSLERIRARISTITRKSAKWSREREWERIEGSRTSPIKNAIQHFLFAHGDTANSLEPTKKVLDELLTDFITETCFEAHRSAQLAGRQKIKLDDIKFACRKNPSYLGKIQETLDKKAEIDAARKLLDQNDDKITKSNVKALEEEPLNDADDDLDAELKIGSRSTSVGIRK